MRTIRTKVYQFSELSKQAKQTAIEKFWDVNVSYKWWESTYEDAENIGLKITGFDIDQGSYCEGDFTLSAAEVAANIIRDHGEKCETYKTATNFLEEFNPVFAKYFETEEGEGELMELEEAFKKSLCEDYRIMLSQEYEYQTSKPAIIETIEANEYEFTKDGELFNK